MPAPVTGLDGQLIVGISVPSQPKRSPQIQAPATAPLTATPFKPAGERTDSEETAADRTISETASTMTIRRIGSRLPQSRRRSNPR